MIELVNVTLSFGAQKILESASLRIGEGEFVYIIGETGIGKSTFLRLLYMDVFPESGSVRVGGFDSEHLSESQIPYLRRTLGVVFQDYRLLEDRNVYENVAFTLHVTGIKASLIRERVMAGLAEVGLTSKEKAMPGELSGGEKQRVAIARALVNKPALLLADEPTGNLDPQASREVLAIFDRINRKGTGVILATHDYELLKSRPARTIRIHKRTFMEITS